MKSWTISKIHLHDDCPQRFALEYEPAKVIDRFEGWELTSLPSREAKHPAAARGEAIHKMFEKYLLTGKKPNNAVDYIEVFSAWYDELKELRERINSSIVGGTEILWAYDDEWYPLEADRRSHREMTWHRQKLDAWLVAEESGIVIADVIDFKTGKVYPQKHADAMEVYGLGTLARFDDAAIVRTHLWYLDVKNDNPIVTKEYSREEDAPRLAKRWESRAKRFIEEKAFKARVNNYCGWCPFNAKNGGPCKEPQKAKRQAAQRRG